jgi:hypothetical protein
VAAGNGDAEEVEGLLLDRAGRMMRVKGCAGQRRQIGKQTVKAVHLQPIVGRSTVCWSRHLASVAFGDNAVASGFGRFLVGIVVEHPFSIRVKKNSLAPLALRS